LVADILDSRCNFVLRTVDEIVLDSFCFSTAVAGAGVVQRYIVQIGVESAFSESESMRRDFCRSCLEKYSIAAGDIWLDVVEVSFQLSRCSMPVATAG